MNNHLLLAFSNVGKHWKKTDTKWLIQFNVYIYHYIWVNASDVTTPTEANQKEQLH